MKTHLHLALLLAFSLPSPAQQSNAASANKDTSATSGDQITKPAGAKGSTLIGCLEGPGTDGKYMVRNMAHRYGVQVMGSDDLKNDSGSKVKLTGQWQPVPESEQDKKSHETHRFQATDVEVLSQTCKRPSETTPVSKNKPQKPTTYNAPSPDDSK
ncbi:MAG TPA: hypothetical protein VKB58_11520 [Terriglobales bacterium]|jgi:hypothetical protein|nr:hypothetical protein [Terriglobales bacterium]